MNIYQPIISGSLTVTGSTTFFGNITINSGSLTMTSGSLTGTASFSTSASYAYTASSATSASYVLNAVSSSYAFTASSATNSTSASKAVSSSYSDTASFSNNFTVLGNLTVFGTQSVQYITSSQLNVANNIINVNVGTPGVRFGGLSVFDSGSTAGATGSLFWDSQNNNWVYQQVTGSTYTGGMLISGPRNTGGLGNEQGTTSGSLMKGQGGDHMTSSAIFEDGYKATVYTNVLVVSSSGLVGIGTTNPTNTLFVAGTGSLVSVGNAYGGTVGETRELYLGNTVALKGYNEDGGSNLGFRVQTWSSGPVTALNIKGNGNVGIGLTNPSYTLDVTGSMRVTNVLTTYCPANANGTGLVIQATTTGAGGSQPGIQWNNNSGVGKFNIYYDVSSTSLQWGNTLGTTFLTLASNGYMTATASGSYTAGNFDIWNFLAPNQTGGALSFNIGKSLSTYNNASIKFNYAGNSSTSNRLGFGFYDNDNILNVTAAGSVGIGTASPVQKLHVEGSAATGTVGTESIFLLGRALSSGVSFQQAAALKLGRYTSPGGIYESRTRLDIALKSDAAASDYSTDVTVMTFTNGGNVGIGSTNPLAIFDVVGSSSSTRPTMYMTQTGYGQIAAQDKNHSIILRGYPTDYTNYSVQAADVISFCEYGDDFRFYRKSDANNMQVQVQFSGGVIYARNTTVQALSDIRTKENIRNSEEGLDIINALRPVRFDFKEGYSDGKKNQLGFIAQEVEEIFPDAVSEMKDNVEVEGQPLKTVGPAALIPVLVKAIQEQQAQIEELKALINK